MGTGAPKLQPIAEQSGSLLLTAGGVAVGAMLQLSWMQLSENRMVEPPAARPSATIEPPPPMLKPPQLRFLTTVEVSSFTVPQTPPAGAIVKSRTPDAHGGRGQVVVVVNVVVGQGFGAHEPGPKSTPGPLAHVDAGRRRQLPKAQHWIAGRVVDVAVGQGFGKHEPGPKSTPPALAHWGAGSTKQTAEGPTEPKQHWIPGRVGQGYGKHEPGPKSTPPTLAHSDAGSTIQVPKAQHWIAGRVVLVGQGLGTHEPGPRLNPPALAHWFGVPTKQATKAPIEEPGTQHWIPARFVDVVVDVVVVLMVGLVVDVVDVVVAVVGGGLLVVVVVGPAQVPSGSHASNVLKKPSTAPHAFPFLHFAALPTIDDLTFPFFLRTQQTAAFGLPQIDAFSHFMMSVRHAFCGIRAVKFAALSVLLTHCSYLPCVCPSRVHPQVLWIIPRALSMAALSEHFALTQDARASGIGMDSTRAARATASRHFIS
jgi:hypothetical protein